MRIREKHRIVASLPQDWWEYQVVGQRGKVLFRADLREQAVKWCEERGYEIDE